ncbi:MAG: hypothetical protein GY928_33720 [Colwellia sp.]|nr:hypothetical protein [Colwellia sp.]
MKCEKLKHKTKGLALSWQARIDSNVPYMAYQCPHCFPCWHITTKDTPEYIVDEIRTLIQSSSEYAKVKKKISQRVRQFEVETRFGVFLVRYCKRSSEVEVLNQKVNQESEYA